VEVGLVVELLGQLFDLVAEEEELLEQTFDLVVAVEEELQGQIFGLVEVAVVEEEHLGQTDVAVVVEVLLEGAFDLAVVAEQTVVVPEEVQAYVLAVVVDQHLVAFAAAGEGVGWVVVVAAVVWVVDLLVVAGLGEVD